MLTWNQETMTHPRWIKMKQFGTRSSSTRVILCRTALQLEQFTNRAIPVQTRDGKVNKWQALRREGPTLAPPFFWLQCHWEAHKLHLILSIWFILILPPIAFLPYLANKSQRKPLASTVPQHLVSSARSASVQCWTVGFANHLHRATGFSATKQDYDTTRPQGNLGWGNQPLCKGFCKAFMFFSKRGKTKAANIALGACLNVQCLEIGRASSCMHECRSPLIYLQLKEFYLHGGSRW